MDGQNLKTTSRPSEALVAVAYQDLLLQDLAIGNLSLSNTSYKNVRQKLNKKEKERKKSLQKIKSKVDSGRSNFTSTNGKSFESFTFQEKREYVLDPLPKKPNLAQKIGLVPLPPQPLSDAEWKEMKQKSIARDDFKNPCAICQDTFRLEDQVLLSCSHVFHKTCIQAFERFTGKKTCPMCRKMQYQSRVVYEGSRFYHQQCATKIQSYWRGYVVREWYLNLRKTVPPNNPELRKVFYENKLQEITDRMVAMTSGESVERLINHVDESVLASRKIFDHFEKTQLERISDDTWQEIQNIALQREHIECSICLQKLDYKNSAEILLMPPILQENANNKLCLLSCSHLFHTQCINSLEEFYLVESRFENGSFSDDLFNENISNEIAKFPTCFKCPVCRSLYVKKVL